MVHKVRHPEAIVDMKMIDGKLYEFYSYALTMDEAKVSVKELPRRLRRTAVILPKSRPDMKGNFYEVYMRSE